VRSENLYEVNSFSNLPHIKKRPQLKLQAKDRTGMTMEDSDNTA